MGMTGVYFRASYNVTTWPPNATACPDPKSSSGVPNVASFGGQEDQIIQIAVELAQERRHVL